MPAFAKPVDYQFAKGEASVTRLCAFVTDLVTVAQNDLCTVHDNFHPKDYMG